MKFSIYHTIHLVYPKISAEKFVNNRTLAVDIPLLTTLHHSASVEIVEQRRGYDALFLIDFVLNYYDAGFSLKSLDFIYTATGVQVNLVISQKKISIFHKNKIFQKNIV